MRAVVIKYDCNLKYIFISTYFDKFKQKKRPPGQATRDQTSQPKEKFCRGTIDDMRSRVQDATQDHLHRTPIQSQRLHQDKNKIKQKKKVAWSGEPYATHLNRTRVSDGSYLLGITQKDDAPKSTSALITRHATGNVIIKIIHLL